MSRGYIKHRRRWMGPVPAEHIDGSGRQVVVVLNPSKHSPPRSEPLRRRPIHRSLDDLLAADKTDTLRYASGPDSKGIRADLTLSDRLPRYGSGGDTSDSSSYSSLSLCMSDGSYKRSPNSHGLVTRVTHGDPVTPGDHSVLDYLGCRQITVVPMETPKMSRGAATPKSTLSRATGVPASPSSSEKKALESMDGNWVLKNDLVQKSEKAKVHSLQARNMAVSDKLSSAKKEEKKKRRQRSGSNDAVFNSDTEQSLNGTPSPLQSPGVRAGSPGWPRGKPHMARAFSSSDGVHRVESPQKSSILARDQSGNLYVVPVLDTPRPGAYHHNKRKTRTRMSSGSSAVLSPYGQNQAFVFSVPSRSNSVPDLLDETPPPSPAYSPGYSSEYSPVYSPKLSPYVATASRQPYQVVAQTLPKNFTNQKVKRQAPKTPDSPEYVASTMPRNWGSKSVTKGKNIYQGAIVRVQVPGKYHDKTSDSKRAMTPDMNRSQSVDEEARAYRSLPRKQEVKHRSRSTGNELDQPSDRHDNKTWHNMPVIDSEIHIEDNDLSGNRSTGTRSILRNKNQTTQDRVNYGIMRISQVSLAQVIRWVIQ